MFVLKNVGSCVSFLLFVTVLFYGGYICGKNDSPPFHDKIYLPGCTDKHYIVVGTLDEDKNVLNIYSNNNSEVIVMSPNKDTTRKILNAIDKAINESYP